MANAHRCIFLYMHIAWASALLILGRWACESLTSGMCDDFRFPRFFSWESLCKVPSSGNRRGEMLFRKIWHLFRTCQIRNGWGCFWRTMKGQSCISFIKNSGALSSTIFITSFPIGWMCKSSCTSFFFISGRMTGGGCALSILRYLAWTHGFLLSRCVFFYILRKLR